jgi:hypothetical protein
MFKRGVHRGEETMYIRKCVNIVSILRHTQVRRSSPEQHSSTQLRGNRAYFATYAGAQNLSSRVRSYSSA